MATRQIKRSKHGSNALAPQVRQRIDLDEDFSDVDGDPANEFALVSSDGKPIPPEGDGEYKYVWADGDNAESGIPAFVRMIPPREVVYFDETSVRPRGGEKYLKVGDRIESRGQVLMRASRALCEKRERFEQRQYQRIGKPIEANRTSDVDLTEDRAAGARARAGLGATATMYRDNQAP